MFFTWMRTTKGAFGDDAGDPVAIKAGTVRQEKLRRQ